MKKLLVFVLLVLLAFSGTAFAQEDGGGSKYEPLMAPGNLAVTAGLGTGFFWGAIDVSGGVEVMLSRVDLAGEFPITFGVAGKASYYRYDYSGLSGNDYWSYLGGGGFATAHFGLQDKNLDENLKWLANVDTYIGLGIGFYDYSDSYYTYSYEGFGIGFRTTGGVSYFLSPNFAITFEGSYYGYYSSGLIGVLLKL